MPLKNIVICCDGTGQTIRAAPGADSNSARTNVLRLYDLVVKDGPGQIACYDPGLGTAPALRTDNRQLRAARNLRDEWFGAGLMANVGEMYRYLMECYAPGDRIFLFGFSRGAFTVRALAGIIRAVGLLYKGQEHLLPYARDVFENMEVRHRLQHRHDQEAADEMAAAFRRYARQEVPIAFLGVWDTVKSWGYLKPRGLPHVRNNAIVDVVRHAVSIDEKRPPFQVTGWSDRVLRQQRLSDVEIDRRIKEVWFAGDHSDVGGGHDGNNILAKAPFDWILSEAIDAGLEIDPERYKDATGWNPSDTPPDDCPPHDFSQSGAGRLFQALPLRELDNSTFPPGRKWRWDEGKGTRVLLSHTFPDPVWLRADGRAASADRQIQPFVWVHDAVDRAHRNGRAPSNLADVYLAREAGMLAVRTMTSICPVRG